MNCLAVTFVNNSLVDLWDDERLECESQRKVQLVAGRLPIQKNALKMYFCCKLNISSVDFLIYVYVALTTEFSLSAQ